VPQRRLARMTMLAVSAMLKTCSRRIAYFSVAGLSYCLIFDGNFTN
jgi:hypothetical protein